LRRAEIARQDAVGLKAQHERTKALGRPADGRRCPPGRKRPCRAAVHDWRGFAGVRAPRNTRALA
jgi:hypothetical protein